MATGGDRTGMEREMSDADDGVYFADETGLELTDAPLAFESENRKQIDKHWAEAVAAKPRMWNGPFFLFTDAEIAGGMLRGMAHRTDYATFLFWRDHGRPHDIAHITGTSLPVTADGALFAVRMSAHTANAGNIYFPAGSLDEDDLDGGRFDLTRSIARELAEETGFIMGGTVIDRDYAVARAEGCYHVTRRNRLPHDFATCARLLAQHQAAGGDDETDAAVAIRKDDDSRALLRPYARILADWHFENPV
jgi:hypothetical protein